MKKENLYKVAGIIYIALMAAITETMGDFSFGFMIALLVLCFGIAYLFDLFVLSIPTVADLEKRVMIKMNEEGFLCKKNEGVLEYTM